MTCCAIEAIHTEYKRFADQQPSANVLAMFALGGPDKIEHFEIAGYRGLVGKAMLMGETKCAQLLEIDLVQEETAGKLERFAHEPDQWMLAPADRHRSAVAAPHRHRPHRCAAGRARQRGDLIGYGRLLAGLLVGEDVAGAGGGERGHQPAYGARPLAHTIQRNFGNRLSRRLLEGQVVAGDHVVVGVEDGDISFSTVAQP